MITIKKLETLPRKTRLRKIITILQEFEQRAAENREIDPAYLAALLALLAEESKLPGWMASKFPGHIEAVKSTAGGAPETLRRICNDIRHGLQQYFGIEPADWDFQDFGTGSLIKEARRVCPFRVYLEDLRSPFNVGSIFRTAESFGVAEIVLSSSVPTPEHKRVQRTAMGTAEIIPWRQEELSAAAGESEVFILETGGTPIDSFQFPANGLAVIGSEELGVSPEAVRLAEKGAGRVTIPTYGAKGSLNVSVAFGILMYRWFTQFQFRISRSISG